MKLELAILPDLIEYQQSQDFQRQCLEWNADDGNMRLLVLEHQPTVTTGSDYHKPKIPPLGVLTDAQIERENIAVHHNVGRRGERTYHGPGQIVGYADGDIRFLDNSIVSWIQLLEAAGISFLRGYGIYAERTGDPSHPGVVVGKKKIASVGIGYYRQDDATIVSHGTAINLNTPGSCYKGLNACGENGRIFTSVAEILGRKIDMTTAKKLYQDSFVATIEKYDVPKGTENLRDRLLANYLLKFHSSVL
jgi:lipoyl(octanoyl) transferase